MTAGQSWRAWSTVTASSRRLQNRCVGRGRLNQGESQADLPTGHCIALVEGAERTLVANLGAANRWLSLHIYLVARYSVEDLWRGNNSTLLEASKVIYVEGYFLSHSPEASMELARSATFCGF